jgi:hypothetical protein
VLEARPVLRVGPDRLADELGVPARTISRILRRNHVPYVFECDPLTGEVIGASKATTFRYERDRPGELLPPVPGKTASRVLQSHVADRVGLTSTFTTNDERGHALPAWLDYYNSTATRLPGPSVRQGGPDQSSVVISRPDCVGRPHRGRCRTRG